MTFVDEVLGKGTAGQPGRLRGNLPRRGSHQLPPLHLGIPDMNGAVRQMQQSLDKPAPSGSAALS